MTTWSWHMSHWFTYSAPDHVDFINYSLITKKCTHIYRECQDGPTSRNLYFKLTNWGSVKRNAQENPKKASVAGHPTSTLIFLFRFIFFLGKRCIGPLQSFITYKKIWLRLFKRIVPIFWNKCFKTWPTVLVTACKMTLHPQNSSLQETSCWHPVYIYRLLIGEPNAFAISILWVTQFRTQQNMILKSHSNLETFLIRVNNFI